MGSDFFVATGLKPKQSFRRALERFQTTRPNRIATSRLGPGADAGALDAYCLHTQEVQYALYPADSEGHTPLQKHYSSIRHFLRLSASCPKLHCRCWKFQHALQRFLLAVYTHQIFQASKSTTAQPIQIRQPKIHPSSLL